MTSFPHAPGGSRRELGIQNATSWLEQQFRIAAKGKHPATLKFDRNGCEYLVRAIIRHVDEAQGVKAPKPKAESES